MCGYPAGLHLWDAVGYCRQDLSWDVSYTEELETARHTDTWSHQCRGQKMIILQISSCNMPSGQYSVDETKLLHHLTLCSITSSWGCFSAKILGYLHVFPSIRICDPRDDEKGSALNTQISVHTASNWWILCRDSPRSDVADSAPQELIPLSVPLTHKSLGEDSHQISLILEQIVFSLIWNWQPTTSCSLRQNNGPLLPPLPLDKHQPLSDKTVSCVMSIAGGPSLCCWNAFVQFPVPVRDVVWLFHWGKDGTFFSLQWQVVRRWLLL